MTAIFACWFYVGHRELIDTLAKDEQLCRSKAAMNGLEDLKLLFKYCDLMGILDKVWFIVTTDRVYNLVLFVPSRYIVVSVNILYIELYIELAVIWYCIWMPKKRSFYCKVSMSCMFCCKYLAAKNCKYRHFTARWPVGHVYHPSFANSSEICHTTIKLTSCSKFHLDLCILFPK